jgi:hypothetical protein
VVPVPPAGAAIQRYLRRPPLERKPVSYNRELVDSYRPNVEFYPSPEECAQLRTTGARHVAAQAAGTNATFAYRANSVSKRMIVPC